MRGTSFMRVRRASIVAAVCSALLGLTLESKADEKKELPKPSAMIEALANKNAPPKIVQIGDGPEGLVAVFPLDYDWKEQARVEKALLAILADERIEVWDAMMAAADDRRFCLTARDPNVR